MSTVSSKSAKRHDPDEFLSIVIFLVLTLTILLVPFTTNIYPSTNALTDKPAALSATSDVVFLSDLEYWNANCSHGWSGKSRCSTIVRRTQSCANSVDSAYCSEYENYLKNFAE